MSKDLDLAGLQCAVRNGAAIRRIARLQPAGGISDKVFPPTYEGGTYAYEGRVVDGTRVPCVLLDSVQSQANRMEACLLEAHRAGRIAIPVVTVDFGKAGLPEVGPITSLDAPHRLADAILRDSTYQGKSFRDSDYGRLLNTATVANATGLFGVCPTALLFGLWDSAGPRGGSGTKFARAIVGEIFGVDIEAGVRPSSRIDPLGIQLNAGPIYQKGETWTLVETDADRDEKDKKKAKRIGKEGKPSEINHGNVTPSLKTEKGGPNHGGVTFRYACHTVVLSLPGLRRLRFPNDDGKLSTARDEAGRDVLGALALAAMTLTAVSGYDLRSRCLLVPDATEPAGLELVENNGIATPLTIDTDGACTLLRTAVDAAVREGLPWHSSGIVLEPKSELVELVKRSRALAQRTGAEG